VAFQKGQSGNPGGRPRENNEVKKLAQTFSQEAIEKLAEWMRSDNSKASVAACSALLDRAVGKPPQAIVGGEEDDAPLRLVARIERIVVHANAEDSNSESV